MLIGIDVSRANRDHKSGTEWYSYYLIRWLAKLDKKNKYILYTDKPLKNGLSDLTSIQHFNDKNNEDIFSFDKKGYQKIKSPYNNFKAKILKWPFSFFWTLGRLSLEMLFKKPDILFVPSHSLPLISPKKTISTMHDVAFEKNKDLYRKDIIGPSNKKIRKLISFFVKVFTFGKYNANSLDYLKWSSRFVLKNSKKIITVSNFSKKEIMNIYCSGNDQVFFKKNCKEIEEKIKVIYNGYNNFLYKKVENNDKNKSILKKYGIEEPYILYTGRIEKKKNTSALVEAFVSLREKGIIKHKLVLVGDASFGYDEVNYILRENHFDSEVIMTGWAKEEDLPILYSFADVFVFPSKYEGFGIPILQAMGCETPIVASDIPVFREIAKDSALFFNPNDINSIAESIKKVILDSKLREKLINKGRSRIKNFSWEKCALEVLRELNDL